MINHILSLENCQICPRTCRVNRFQTVGYCKASTDLKINLSQLHFGEEPVISGQNGSGTIFFSNCNLSCVFCQNYKISQHGNGTNYTITELVSMLLHLQSQKAQNINLVTPTHFTPQIIDALKIAKKEGLTIPVVWNSNAYEEIETLKQLDGLVDIYLPDLKYFDSNNSMQFSGAANYFEKAKKAIKEMYWQVGNLQIENEIAWRGIMIRILILPNNLNSIEQSLEWVFKTFGTEIYISLMSQYYPTFQAKNFDALFRGIKKDEHDFAVAKFHQFGFQNGFIQGISSSDKWTPDFIH